MKMMILAAVAMGLSASPALAQDEAPAKPKMCKMMHGDKEMHGMMVKGEDGKMTCKMMDHSKMGDGKMGQAEKKDAPAAKPKAQHQHD